MIDLYLKSSTKGVMTKALKANGLTDDEGNPAAGVLLDVIGTINEITGEDADGNPIVTALPGWHVNVRADLSDEVLSALKSYIITPPATPYRVWA